MTFLWFTTAALAQVNDNCSGAIDVDLYAPANCPNSNINVNFNNSTISTNPPFCDVAGSQIRDLWYRFYSANNTTVTIYLESSQSSYIGFGIYTSCGSAAVACLSGMEDFCGHPGEPEHPLLPADVLLGQLRSSTSAIFCLHWNNAPPAPPTNDECANATLLNVGSTCNYTSGNSAWATYSIGNPTATRISSQRTTTMCGTASLRRPLLPWYPLMGTAQRQTDTMRCSY
ncbi:MAG: hypothetical protein IPJ85_12540 [Flavobacteriales bacterium]|nr:hypothetical protein [Flavobacteriales bacterium]